MRTVRLLAAGVALILSAVACLTGCGSSSGSDGSEVTTSLAIAATTLADEEACVADLKTLETVIRAWTVMHDGDPGTYPTPWPKDQDAVIGPLLKKRSTLFDFSGDGTVPPTITKLPGQCPTTTVFPITPLVADQLRN